MTARLRARTGGSLDYSTVAVETVRVELSGGSAPSGRRKTRRPRMFWAPRPGSYRSDRKPENRLRVLGDGG